MKDFALTLEEVRILVTALAGSVYRQGGMEGQPDSVYALLNKMRAMQDRMTQDEFDKLKNPVGRESVNYDFIPVQTAADRRAKR